jgi:hypothetical protein
MALGRAVGNVLRFEDNYGEGIDNFLYNAPESFHGETIVAYETGPSSATHELVGRLGARAVLF